MRIGFDLDGVLFDHIQYNGNLKEYNTLISKPNLRLDIEKILLSRRNDVYIITGRAIDNEAITRKTISLLIPWFNLNNLIMANEFNSLKIDGVFLNVEAYFNYIAIRKFKYIDSLKLDFYFEDNPVIIKILRSAESISNYRVIDVHDISLVNEILDICRKNYIKEEN